MLKLVWRAHRSHRFLNALFDVKTICLATGEAFKVLVFKKNVKHSRILDPLMVIKQNLGRFASWLE